TNPNSPSTATCWLALAREWRASRNKANRSTQLSPQRLPPPQTQSGATALGALKTSSETFSRAFDADCERVTEAGSYGSSVGLVRRNALGKTEGIPEHKPTSKN